MNWKIFSSVFLLFVFGFISAQTVAGSDVSDAAEAETELLDNTDQENEKTEQKVYRTESALVEDDSSFSADGVALQKKKKITEELVDKATELFARESLAASCKAFRFGKEWHKGEISVFVFSEKGTCYVSGDESWAIWKKFFEKGVFAGVPLLEKIINVGEQGGWTNFTWNNTMKYAYLRIVHKNGQKYIIGAGFYPESTEFAVEVLVRAAADAMKTMSAAQLFTLISDPNGIFVYGDVYLYAYDFNGTCRAHGANAVLVSQDAIDWKDSDGKYRNRDMIKLVREKGFGWMEYRDGATIKRAFVLGVEDPNTKVQYIIGAGYYPAIDSDVVRAFVNKAIAHVKEVGKERAFADFSSRVKGFVNGPLTIFAYDQEGVMLADGANPIFVGQNLIKSKDSSGQFVTKNIIDFALSQDSGWLGMMNKKAYENLYVQHVDFPGGNFIIGSGYWPASKKHSIQTLVWRAEAYAKDHSIEETCDQLTQMDSEYIAGDSFVSVFTFDGICLANGPAKNDIWMTSLHKKDATGKTVFDMLKSTAQSVDRGGWVTVKYAEGEQEFFVRKVEKNIAAQVSTVKTKKTKRVKNIQKKEVVQNKEKLEYILTCCMYK
jgi:hypothetical protein